jgi:hypothetical protein
MGGRPSVGTARTSSLWAASCKRRNYLRGRPLFETSGQCALDTGDKKSPELALYGSSLASVLVRFDDVAGRRWTELYDSAGNGNRCSYSVWILITQPASS